MLGVNEVVRIRNLGLNEWHDSYANQKYVCQPGGEVIAPFPAACLWFGHPDAADLGPQHMYRNDEYQRLRIKYGVYENDTQWAANIPAIEVYDLDGNRLITVIEDPEGNHLAPASPSIAQQDELVATMESMQRQIRALQAQIDDRTRQEQAEYASGDIEEDSSGVPEQMIQPVQVTPEGPPVATTSAFTSKVTKVSGAPAHTPESSPVPVSEDTPVKVKVSH